MTVNMTGETQLRLAHVLACRRRFCRVAVIAAVILLVSSVTMVSHLRRRPVSRVSNVNTSDVLRNGGPSLPNVLAPPSGHDNLTSTSTGGSTARCTGDRVTCRRWAPMDDGDDAVRRIFFSTEKANCNHQKRHEICRIETVSPRHSRVVCAAALCVASRGFLLGVVNTSTGLVSWRHMTSQLNLEDELALIIHPTRDTPHFGFCFVRCISLHSVKQYVEQLVLLPVKEAAAQKPLRAAADRKFNFNIIWLDSVARSHFIRSLPNSTNLIRTLQTQAATSQNATRVFDFQLFQSIKARTREMLSMLWSGEYPRNNDMFRKDVSGGDPIRVETLFGSLKRAGYKTLWLEDSCWRYQSDLTHTLAIKHRNLTLVARWQHIVAALERASIDAVDVSLAMCVMFWSLGITDQFHGPPALCHNGHHVHDYLFDYLRAYQRATSSTPHATFLITNVAHEDTGRRLQTLDDRLAAYLSFAASLPDTVTLVLSDHGNSYGVYPETSLDGRRETYNPVMLVFVPARVRRQLGRRRLDALAVNERRLVSMRDVHLCLCDFVSVATGRGRTAPAGLSGDIPANRTCDNLSIDPLAYCVCRDGSVAKPSDDWQAIVAEFAVGTLNDVIRTQYQAALPVGASEQSLPPSCRRLVPFKFGNATEKYQKNNHVMTKLDVHVSTPLPGRRREVFVVTVRYSVGLTETSSSLSLVGYDRVTRYSEYESCADRGVDIRLCICHTPITATSGGNDVSRTSSARSSSFVASRELIERPPVTLRRQTITYAVDTAAERPCLYVLCRKYDVGAVFELVNVCDAATFVVSFRLTGVNVDTSAAMPATLRLPPRQQRFLSTVRQAVVHRSWSWSYVVDFSIVANSTHAQHDGVT